MDPKDTFTDSFHKRKQAKKSQYNKGCKYYDRVKMHRATDYVPSTTREIMKLSHESVNYRKSDYQGNSMNPWHQGATLFSNARGNRIDRKKDNKLEINDALKHEPKYQGSNTLNQKVRTGGHFKVFSI
mmetsp:Transcript_22348/g.19250  ORF Transcript_22348/g.19250 Transcript_22348/m.19250 type:complete len:128 (+) Transcript_22348:82-465(+)